MNMCVNWAAGEDARPGVFWAERQQSGCSIYITPALENPYVSLTALSGDGSL